MQFQVPQFIETEDKIVGPLSLKQFAYFGVAVLLSALLYFTLQIWLFAIGALILFGIAFALSFIKIEGRPFVNVMISAFNFYWKPQTYVWQPEYAAVTASHAEKTDTGGSGLESILAGAAARTKRSPLYNSSATPRESAGPLTRETVRSASALHKSWEDVQTGAPLVKKNSDKQFLEKKMSERYQIFQKLSGERNAAKRVDYR